MKKNHLFVIARPLFAIAIVGLAVFVTNKASGQEQDVWTGADSAAQGVPNWSDALNWSDPSNAAPSPGDSLVFSGGNVNNNNDYADGTGFDGITFTNTSSEFVLNGNSILLTGNASGNTIGILNNSGVAQTVDLNLSLDWGYYTFQGGAGGLALDGSSPPSLNTGGVAWLDSGVASSTMSLDPVTGLINSLEGNGLFYMDNSNAPVGLATLNGGNIVPYTAYTPQNQGSLPTSGGNNLEFQTTTTSGAYTLSGPTTVNTITSQQTTATDTISLGGNTLSFGDNGGVYLLSSGTLGNKSCLTFAAGGWITAGTSSSPATLLFAINGNNPNNQCTVNCAIKDNLSGGSVSVITTGPGSINFANSTSNSYSGGTYITEGQLQWVQATHLGTGPVYVSSNATAYYTGTVQFNDPFYLSPGYGSPTAAAIAGGGALLMSGTNVKMGGTLYLEGEAVTTGPGVRVGYAGAGTGTFTLSGQITGPGTLDIANGHSSYIQVGNVVNNWQGGLIVENIKAGANTYFRVGNNDVIPSGADAGDLLVVNAYGPLGTLVYFDANAKTNTINGMNAPAGPYAADEIVGNIQGSAPASLTVGANNANGDFYGVLTNASSANAFSLIKIGTGTQTLRNYGYYNGTTTLEGGTLAIDNGQALGFGPLTLNGGGGSPTGNGITFASASANSYTITNSPVTLSTGATFGEPGTGDLTFTGAVNDGGASKTITANGITVEFDGVISDGGADPGATNTIAGSGTVIFGNADTYNKPTVISSGTLALNALGSINETPSISIAAGATLDVSAISSYVWSGSTSLSASGTGTSGSAATINGASGGTVNLGSQPVVLTYDGSDPALYISQGTLVLNGNSFIVNTVSPLTAGVYVLIQQASGSISGSGSLAVSGTAIGAGTTGAISVSGGQVILTIAAPATSKPDFTSVSVSGGILTIMATNGVPNAKYVLLQSTNVGLPVSQWTPVLSNSFDGNGNVNLSTNIINPAVSQEFYILQTP